MELTTSQLATYTKHIDKILSHSNLNTVSVKKVRTKLQDIVGDDLDLTTEIKPALNKLIEERFDIATQNKQEEIEDSIAIEKEEEAKRKEKKERTNAKVKREADGEEDDAKPAKKRKTSTSTFEDSKLAALLQAEENRYSRPTRGAAVKKKPVAKTEKRKRAKKVKADSEPEYDSEGNEIKKVKKGAFHKEYLLSEPLGILVGGEAQLSRPQVVKKIWEHIKAHDLQVPNDKRQITCDEKMRAVFKQDQVHMFTMNKLLGKHFYPLEDGGAEPKKEAKRTKGEKSNTRVKDENEDEDSDEKSGPEDTPAETPSTKEETPSTKEETPASEEE